MVTIISELLQHVASPWGVALGAVIALCSMTTRIVTTRYKARAGIIAAETAQLVATSEQARLDKNDNARLEAEGREQERIDKLGQAHLAALHELIQRWRSEPDVPIVFPSLAETAEEAAPEKVSKAA